MKPRTMLAPGILVTTLFLMPSLHAQRLNGPDLIGVLKKGGYVIVVRHARSPSEEPDEQTANPDNSAGERQLDQLGRADATTMGRAMRDLGIPVGSVQTSPTYRARETVRLAGWESAQIVPELGDRGQSMAGVTEKEGAWLRQQVAQFPAGTNSILVTHLPNITRAFPQDAEGVEDGDALVFGPGTGDAAVVVGRIKIGEWRTAK